MTNWYDDMVRHFKDDGWALEEHPDRKQIRADSRFVESFCKVIDDRCLIIFVSLIKTTIPEDRRLNVCEFANRANAGEFLGTWEIEMDSGLVAFKSVIPMPIGASLDKDMFLSICHYNRASIEGHLEAIINIASGEETPEEAIDKVKKST